MKINHEKMEITASQSIFWKDVQVLRLINEKLALVLKSGKVIELTDLRPSTIDLAFRAYEKYVTEHPKRTRAK